MPLVDWGLNFSARHPDLDWIFQHAKAWQSLIGSLVGFSGIILTLRANAALNRRTEATRNRTEAVNLEAALSAELGNFYDSILKLLVVVENIVLGNASTNLSMPPKLDIYTANLANLGKIGEYRVRSIIKVASLRTELVSILRTTLGDESVSDQFANSGKAIPLEDLRKIAVCLDNTRVYCLRAIKIFDGTPWTNIYSARLGYYVEEGTGVSRDLGRGILLGILCMLVVFLRSFNLYTSVLFGLILFILYFGFKYGAREIDINEKMRQHEAVWKALGVTPSDQIEWAPKSGTTFIPDVYIAACNRFYRIDAVRIVVDGTYGLTRPLMRRFRSLLKYRAINFHSKRIPTNRDEGKA
jgi:hypothetical protein